MLRTLYAAARHGSNRIPRAGSCIHIDVAVFMCEAALRSAAPWCRATMVGLGVAEFAFVVSAQLIRRPRSDTVWASQPPSWWWAL